MAIAKETQSPTGSEHAAEETLPLYEEFQYSDAQAETIPPPTATSDEVRAYLISLLRDRHSLPDDHARRVVARWTLGTGKELRSYTPQMYLDIFGREEGWFLYRDVRMDAWKAQKKTFLQKYAIHIFATIAVTLDFVLIMLATLATDETVQTFAIVLMFPAAILSLPVTVFSICQCVWGDNPEAKIEGELQRCTTREAPK